MTFVRSLSRIVRRTTPILAAIAAAAALGATPQLAIDASPQGSTRSTATVGEHRTWRDYGGGPDSSKFVTLDQINKSNVSQLRVAWTYPTSDNLNYQFNPIIVDNVMYVLAKNNSLVALNATTGEEIWIHANLRGIARRGVNYWESPDRKDRRLLLQMNNFLQAIDAQTGKSILSFGDNGLVDLKMGLGRDGASVRAQSDTPGKIFENIIMLGSSVGEGYLSPPGHLRAFDVVTGKQIWMFHTIPQPGEFGYDTWPKDAYKYAGGANTWGEISVDARRGIAYFPTGSPTYDYYGADRIGANLFGNCLLALDARTGKRLWHFQAVHHDLWDYDLTAAPQLVTVRRNGRTIDAVAQASKQGFMFVFDRVTGEPVFPIEERPVPKSDVPGEQAWPTQPFPTALPPFARQTMTENDISPYFLSAEERAAWTERLKKARKGLFNPPSTEETVAVPGAVGGVNWGNTAANPAAGLVYVMSQDFPSFYKLTTDPSGGMAGAGRGGGAAAGLGGRGQQSEASAARGRLAYRADLPVLSRRRPRGRRWRRRTIDRRGGRPHGLSGLSASDPRRPRPHAGLRDHRRADDDRALLAPRRPARHRWPRRGTRRQTAVGSGRGFRRRPSRAGPAGRRRTGLERVSRRRRRSRCAVLHRLRPRQSPHHDRTVVSARRVPISMPARSSGRCRSASTEWPPSRAAPTPACRAAPNAWE